VPRQEKLFLDTGTALGYEMDMTALSAVVAARIGTRALREAAAESGLTISTLSKVRAGAWKPLPGVVATGLASWLGWDVGAVLEAAGRPAEVCGCCGRALL